MDELREKLAALAHDRWAGWMAHLFDKSHTWSGGEVEISVDEVRRWKRQMGTPYEQLSEKEKESDRKEADLILELFAEYKEATNG